MKCVYLIFGGGMQVAEWVVEPTPGNEKPFAAIFRQGEHVIFGWPVDSEAEGEERVIAAIEAWRDMLARRRL